MADDNRNSLGKALGSFAIFLAVVGIAIVFFYATYRATVYLMRWGVYFYKRYRNELPAAIDTSDLPLYNRGLIANKLSIDQQNGLPPDTRSQLTEEWHAILKREEESRKNMGYWEIYCYSNESQWRELISD